METIITHGKYKLELDSLGRISIYRENKYGTLEYLGLLGNTSIILKELTHINEMESTYQEIKIDLNK